VDGSSSRAGPDLVATGDKFGRREIIDAVLNPSASIAVGYSTTTIETKSGEEYAGIIKQITATEVGLMGADAKLVTVPAGDIATRRTSDVSLMPEGLQTGLTLQEFTDLIEYLVSLKQPEHTDLTHHGMPDTIPMLRQPVQLRPVHGPNVRFEHPVCFEPVPGESNVFLVAEHETGKIWRLVGRSPESKTLFLDTGVHDQGARGLLGLAFHPRFAENRRYYVAKQVGERGQFASVIFERETTPDGTADSGRPPRLILRVEAATNIDHAGDFLFGPDGYLYIGMGDTGPPEDPQGHGQDTKVLLAKILRVDVDHRAPNQAYSIPRDNPFIGRPDFRPEIWAYGIREPWRFSFDRATGELWVGDVGQDRYEEVDIVRRGENFGWNVYEGFEPFSNRYRRENEKYVSPVFAYRRRFGPCVTGGYVYRANPKSSFYGVYVFGDYESRRIFGLTQRDRVLKVVRQIGTAPERIASFSEGPAGELYVVGYEGTMFKLDFSMSRFE
jgi:putative heme-binding domain-containing protein